VGEVGPKLTMASKIRNARDINKIRPHSDPIWVFSPEKPNTFGTRDGMSPAE
jgi:hypothetical protein